MEFTDVVTERRSVRSYADELPRKFRRPVEEVTHFETFDADSDGSDRGDDRAAGDRAADGAETTITDD